MEHPRPALERARRCEEFIHKELGALGYSNYFSDAYQGKRSLNRILDKNAWTAKLCDRGIIPLTEDQLEYAIKALDSFQPINGGCTPSIAQANRYRGDWFVDLKTRINDNWSVLQAININEYIASQTQSWLIMSIIMKWVDDEKMASLPVVTPDQAPAAAPERTPVDAEQAGAAEGGNKSKTMKKERGRPRIDDRRKIRAELLKTHSYEEVAKIERVTVSAIYKSNPL